MPLPLLRTTRLRARPSSAIDPLAALTETPDDDVVQPFDAISDDSTSTAASALPDVALIHTPSRPLSVIVESRTETRTPPDDSWTFIPCRPLCWILTRSSCTDSEPFCTSTPRCEWSRIVVSWTVASPPYVKLPVTSPDTTQPSTCSRAPWLR